LQALGAAGSVAVFPLVHDRFDEVTGARIISLIMAMIIVAPMVAPILGGYILIFAGWRALFALIAVLGIVSLVSTSSLIKEPRRQSRPFSASTVLSGYSAVFSERRIVLAILAGGFAFAGLFAFVAGSPFVYITYFGVAPQHYGYLVGLNAAAMIAVNLINAQFLGRFEPVAKVYAGSIVLLFSGMAILGVVTLGLGLWPIVAAVVLFFAAMAITETNAVIAAFSVLPKENGTVAAVNGAFQFGVGALSSLLISVLASTDTYPLAFVMAVSAVAVATSAFFLQRDRLPIIVLQ
jgi:MFS transporter, DHA1 family, multidrug resistance protein